MKRGENRDWRTEGSKFTNGERQKGALFKRRNQSCRKGHQRPPKSKHTFFFFFLSIRESKSIFTFVRYLMENRFQWNHLQRLLDSASENPRIQTTPTPAALPFTLTTANTTPISIPWPER